MSAIGSINIRVDKLPKENIVKGKKEDGAVYCEVTLKIQDDTRYGNNLAIIVPQTQEERDAKKRQEYVGNGKIFWTDGVIKLAEKEESAAPENPMPF